MYDGSTGKYYENMDAWQASLGGPGGSSAGSSDESASVVSAPTVSVFPSSAKEVSLGSAYDGYINEMRELYELNHEYDQQVMSFNAAEAEKNRNWQEMMSNTSHQREVADLIAAGLNPVLSAKLGGASTPSGASASGQNSGSGILSSIGSIFGSIINSAAQIMRTEADKEVAYARMGVDKLIAAGNNQAIMYAADKSSGASIYGSNQAYAASVYGSDMSYDASTYSTDIGRENNIRTNQANKYMSENSAAATRYAADKAAESSFYKTEAEVNVDKLKAALDIYKEENYPKTVWSAITSTINRFADTIFDDTGMDFITALYWCEERVDTLYGGAKLEPVEDRHLFKDSKATSKHR